MGEFSDLRDGAQEEVAAKMRIKLGLGTQPDDEARKAQLASRYNLPPELVTEYKPEYEAKARADDIGATLEQSPKLRGWIAEDQYRANISHDDVENMNALEHTFGFFRSPDSDKAFKALDTLLTPSDYITRLDTSGGRQGLLPDIGASMWQLNKSLYGGIRNIGDVLPDVVGDPIADWAAGGAQNSGRMESMLSPPSESLMQSGVSSGVKSLYQNLLTLPLAAEKGMAYGLGAMGGITYGQSYQDAREAGKSTGTSMMFAGAQGGVEVLTEAMPLGKFMGDLAQNAGLRQMLWHQLKTEIPGEQLATAWQDLNEWAVLHPEKSFSDYLAERPSAAAQTLIATVIGVGGNVTVMGAAQAMGDRVNSAQRAEQHADTLRQLDSLAEASKVRGRDAAAFEDFARQATAEGAQDFYISAQTLAQSGLADQLAQVSPSVAQQYRDALATGGEVKIPISEYAARIAGTQYGQALIDDIRVEGEQFTRKEAQQYMQSQAEEVQREVERAVGEKQGDEAFKQSQENVKQFVLEQLNQANRTTPSVNEHYAMLHAAHAAVRGAQLGITPEEYFKQHALKVQGEPMAGGYDQTGKLVTDGPAFKNWFGDSKVTDAEGKPLVVYHSTSAEKDFSRFNKRVGDIGNHFGTLGQAEDRQQYVNKIGGDYKNPRILPVYLSIKNPLRLADAGAWNADNLVYQLRDLFPSDTAKIVRLKSTKDVREFIQSKGYDGVVYKNTGETAGAEEVRKAVQVAKAGLPTEWRGKSSFSPEDQKHPAYIKWGEAQRAYDKFREDNAEDSYIAFEPTQIKSVFNKGTFDPKDPNILHQAESEATYIGKTIMRMVDKLGEDAFIYKDLKADKDLGKSLASTGEEFKVEELTKDDKGYRAAATEQFKVVTADGKEGYVYRFHNDVQIDVSGLKSGDSKGSAVYQGVAAWAHANTYVFEGDDAGITIQGIIRRTENMISSILHFGTSDHLKPHEMQRKPEKHPDAKALNVPGINWRAGDTEHNLGELLLFSQRVVASLSKEAQDVTANQHGSFEEPSFDFTQAGGDVVDDARFKEIVGSIEQAFERFRVPGKDGRINPIGIRTLKRAAVVQSLARARQDGNGDELRPGLSSLLGQFYQPVYHGSPHQFDKFTLDHIGTGEGAQAYGWGLYFAGNKQVAEYYREALAPPAIIKEWKFGSVRLVKGEEYQDYSPRDGSDQQQAKALLSEDMLIEENTIREAFEKEGIEAARKIMLEVADERIAQAKEDQPSIVSHLKVMRSRIETDLTFEADVSKGQLYEADIPEDEHFLNWDKPLGEQPDNIKKLLGIPSRDFAAEEKLFAKAKKKGVPPTSLPEYAKLEAQLDAKLDVLSGKVTVNGVDALSGFSKTDTGEDLYKRLTSLFDSQEEASKFLHKQGIKGLQYLDGSSRDAGEGHHNYVVFDENAIELLRTYYQGNRGAFDPSSNTISLLRNADLSTFLHETAHYFFETDIALATELMGKAERTPGEQQVLDDTGALLKWHGIQGTTEDALRQWATMSFEEKRAYHERTAESFEHYLITGKAPSIELSRAFQHFRAWLLNVYRALKDFLARNPEAGKINDEVRGVFDRMLATTEQITLAEKSRSLMPMFASADQAGMSPDEFAAYAAMNTDASNEAIQELQARGLRDMQWLRNSRGREIAKLQKQAESQRREIRAEVRPVVMSQPVYQVWQFLTGKQQQEEGLQGKLQLDALAAMGLSSEQQGLLKARGMADKEGLHPDMVAELTGRYGSGDELVKALLAADDPKEVIEGAVDQRMLEQHAEVATQRDIEQAADKAIHNELRAKVIATEANALAKAIGGKKIMAEVAREFAAASVSRIKVRDIKPHQYATAETRAARAADKTTDLSVKAAEKRNQLIQHYLAKYAYDAQEEVESIVRYLKKFDNEGTRKNLDTEYLDQIDRMLERFDLRTKSNKELDKRAALSQWIESQEGDGMEPDIPAWMVNEANSTHYRNLTMEELRGLRDSVKQVDHLGRLKKKLLTAKDQRELDAIVTEITENINKNANGRVVDNEHRNTLGDHIAHAARWVAAVHRKAASVVRELDGFKDGGPMWEYFTRGMNEAGDREASMRADASARLHELVKPVLKGEKMGGKGTFFPLLGRNFNRGERIAMALNWGNDGNRQRLMDGKGWTPVQVKSVLDTLTAEDWTFVQGVWDFFESYRPEIAAKEKRVYGREPDWVEFSPFAVKTADGQDITLRGGYYPIKYDPLQSGAAEQFEKEDDAKALMRAAHTAATTRRSFTKTRAEEVKGRPLKLSFDGIWQGANEVIHDLTWHEWLIDSNRLLRRVDYSVRSHYGAEYMDVLRTAVEASARGDIPASNVMERGLNHIRHGSTIVGLGWNVTTSLLQPLGLTNSVVRIGAPWVARGLRQFLGSPQHMVKMADDIAAKSEFMRNRSRTMMREINEIRNQLEANKSDFRLFMEGSYFLLIQKMQATVDYPTWLGAYEKAISEGNDEARSISLADQSVIDAQGGGQIKDLAQVQRGHPAWKIWTNFYSFFNVVLNLSVERTKATDFKKPDQVAALAGDYLLLLVLPAVLGALLKDALKGGDDDDELARKLVDEQISYLMGLVVGGRELAGAAQIATGGGNPGMGYTGPAGIRLFAEMQKLAQQAHQGEADMALLKAVDSVGGILFHYPAGQVNRTVEGTAALIDGSTNNPLAPVVGAPRR